MAAVTFDTPQWEIDNKNLFNKDVIAIRLSNKPEEEKGYQSLGYNRHNINVLFTREEFRLFCTDALYALKELSNEQTNSNPTTGESS